MKFELPIRVWLRNAAAFLASCLVTSALTRLLMLNYEFVFTLPCGFSCVAGSSALAWLVLRRWRTIAPVRCALELGVCGGIGGLGIHTLAGYGITILFPPYFGPIQSM